MDNKFSRMYTLICNLIDAIFLASGLQLYVGKDGTVTFDKNSSRLTNDYQPVVIDGPR